MKQSTKAKLRAAAKTQPRAKGRFAKKYHATDLKFKQGVTPLGDLGEAKRLATIQYIEKRLAQLDHPANLKDSLYDTALDWHTANAYASMTRKHLETVAVDFAAQIGAEKTGKKFTITDQHTGERWAASTGKPRPQYDEQAGVAQFLDGAKQITENWLSQMHPSEPEYIHSTEDDIRFAQCQAIQTLSERMWRASAWSGPRLAAMGVDVYDGENTVCDANRNGWTVQPDSDTMAEVCAINSKYVEIALDTTDLAQKLVTSAHLYALANEHKTFLASRMTVLALADDASRPIHVVSNNDEVVAIVRPSYSYTRWDSNKVHRQLSMQAEHDPSKYAEMIVDARSRSGWSAKSDVPKTEKPPLVSVRLIPPEDED